MVDNQKFIVYCLRVDDHPADGGQAAVNTEIIGIFPSYEEALVARDIHADIDTTAEAVAITSCQEFSQAPVYDVMWKLTVSPDGTAIDMDSCCVPEDTDPWLNITSNFCQSLTLPGDEEQMVDFMVSWAEKTFGVTPEVVDHRSPMALEVFG